MYQSNPVWFWLTLGGLRLRLFLRMFHGVRSKLKVGFLARYYTIAAGKEFLGKILEAPYTLEPGWIIGVRRRPSGKGYCEEWYHVSSLYDFVRLLGHALDSERVGAKVLEIEIDAAIELVRDLLAYWPLSPEKRRRLIRKLLELRQTLEGARDPGLRQAHEAAESSAGFRDRLKRPNPRASAARLSRTGRLMTVRVEDIQRIVPNLSRLQVMAAQELARIHRVFLVRAKDLLTELRAKAPRCTQDQHLRWMMSVLRELRGICQTIQVAPFAVNARYLEREIGQALNILDERHAPLETRVRRVQPLLQTMVHSIAFKRAQYALEEIIKDLSAALAKSGRAGLPETARQALAVRVRTYLETSRRLREDNFRRPRLVKVRDHLSHAARLLDGAAPERAKEALKEASTLL